MNMKRKLFAAIIGAISLFIPIATALALIYSATISITNTGSSISMYPFLFSFNTTGLITGNYISAPTTDVRVLSGSTNLPRMLSDNKLLFAAPVPVGASNYNLTTGNSASDFSVITGYNGYVTTPYNSSLNLGDNFSIETQVGLSSANGNLYDQSGTIVTTRTGSNITSTLSSNTTGTGGFTTSQIATDVAKPFLTNTWISSRNSVIDSSGNIWTVLEKENSFESKSDIVIYRWNRLTDTWDSSEIIANAHTDNMSYGQPTIAIDSNNRMVVAAIGYGSYNGTAVNSFGFSWYSASGTGWTTKEWIDDGSGAIYGAQGTFGRISLIVDGNNYFHVALAYKTLVGAGPNKVFNIRHAIKSAYNAFWGSYAWLTSYNTANDNAEEPELIADNVSGIHLVYSFIHDAIPYAQDVIYQDTLGGAETNISNNGSSQDQQTVLDSHGNTWTAYYGGDGIYVVEKLYGGAWQSPSKISSGDESWDYPTISIDRNDTITVSYLDTTLVYIMGDGATWGTETREQDTIWVANMMWSYWPKIAGVRTNVPATGKWYNVWAPWDGTVTEVDLDFYIDAGSIPSTITVTATGVSSTNPIVKVGTSGGNFCIWINGTLKDSADMGGGSANVSGNDIVWMSNAVPYMNYIKINTASGEVLDYQPASYIVGDNLPDRSGNANHGIITWGSNLGTISGSISGFTPVSTAVSSGSRPDILPNQPVDYTDKGQAPAQKVSSPNVTGLSDVIHVWSDMWQFDTDSVGWVFLAMLLTLFVFWLFAWKLEHVGYAFIASSIVIGFFSAPGINVLPLGGLIFAVLGLVSGVVVEQRA